MTIDPNQLAALQDDDQLTSSPDAAAQAYAEGMRRAIHTSLPGIVQSFDPVTQTAVVQLTIRRLFIGDDKTGQWVDLPPIADAPVGFPGGGGFVWTFPLAKGDECLVSFAERAIDNWLSQGGVQEPSEIRLHDYSDGFVFPGFRSNPNAVPNFFTGGAELRTMDGLTIIRLENGLVTLGGAILPFGVLIAETTTLTWLNAVGTALGLGAFPPTGIATKVKAE